MLVGVAAVPMQAFAYHTPDSVDSIFEPENSDTRLGLSVDLYPPNVMLSDNATSVSFKLLLFERNTSRTVPHVTYLVGLTGLGDDKPVLADVFHSHQGPVELKFNLHDDQTITIRGQRGPVYNAWLADELNTVNIDAARSALGAGAYQLNVTIVGMYNDTAALEKEDVLKFSQYLSMGDAMTEQIAFNGRTYNVKVISYSARIDEFKFDPDSRKFFWSIPFNWDPEYLNNTEGVFVHQEIYVPKAFSEFLGNYSDSRHPFSATVNGKPLTGWSISIDPYSDNSSVAFHYLLSRRAIYNIAVELSNSTAMPDQMTFTLSPHITAVPEFGPMYVLPIARWQLPSLA